MNREFEYLRLFARTKDTSPPSLEIFINNVVSPSVPMVLPIAWSEIRRRIFKEFERRRIVSKLFGFCRNADFVIGMRKPWIEDNPWGSYDVIAVEDTLTNLSKVFAGRPEIPEKDTSPEFDPSRNIISVGGPIPNTFTRKVMGVQKPDDESRLPYSFNLTPPGYKGKTFLELQKMEPEPNWGIMKSDTNEEIYIPEYYEKGERGKCRRDYGMIIKVKSVIENAPRGRKNLVLAGCHGFGTIAAARALGDENILRTIWEKVGDKDFQAIIMCDVNEKDEIEYIELLEVTQL